MIEYENLGKLNQPFMDEYQKKFLKVMQSGWFILGEEVKAFEEEFARECGARHSIGVASGLDALILALRALDFPAGSEVLVPSNTYIATILAILQTGMTPVLVEPRLSTYNINPEEIEKKITSKTKAVLVVHLYGKLCEMDTIQDICQRHRLALIEDCAQSHNASLNGKKAGTFGIGCFSFYPTKNLGALGDAGALTCEDPALNDKFRTLRNYGSRVKYYNEIIGTNSRLDELQAAFLRVKLKALESINEHKRGLAKIYQTFLSDAFIKPVTQDGFIDTFHIYNIRHPRRDQLRQFLLDNGVKTDVHYPVAPHHQVAMKGLLSGSYPISEEIHATTLSLPISTIHSKDDIQKVCEIANKFGDKA